MNLRVATFLSPNYYPLYFYVAESISRHLDTPGLEFVEGKTFEEFQAESFDLAFACGYWYAHETAKYQPLAAPIQSDPRYKGEPRYFVDAVVRADSPFQTFGQLAGKRFAFNEEYSFSGYHALRAELSGPELAIYTANKVKTGSHLRSIEAVLQGEADFATIDSTVLAYEFKNRPGLAARLRIITSFGPYPAPPLLVNRDLPEAVKMQIAAIIENYAPADLAHFGLEGYHRVEASDYTRFEELASCCC